MVPGMPVNLHYDARMNSVRRLDGNALTTVESGVFADLGSLDEL